MTLNDVEMDLSINKFRLDEECLSHPSTYYKYAKVLAEAEELLNERKDNLKVVYAEAQNRVREGFVNAGVKVTEAAVSAAVDIDAEYLNAQKELREMQANYAKFSAVVKAMDARRAALDNLVKLYQSGYFTTTIENNAGRVPQDKRVDDASEAVRQQLLNKGETK